MKNCLWKLAGLAAVGLAAAPAHALLVAESPFCTVANLTPAANQCGGSFDGNNNGPEAADTAAYILATWGAGFSVQGSSDTPGFGPFTSNPSGFTGTLTFDAPIDGPFVLALKGSTQFSLYYFSGAGDPISSLAYTMAGVTEQQGLSHATLYGGVPAIPEPETYALMLAGLAAVGFMARRRRRHV